MTFREAVQKMKSDLKSGFSRENLQFIMFGLVAWTPINTGIIVFMVALEEDGFWFLSPVPAANIGLLLIGVGLSLTLWMMDSENMEIVMEVKSKDVHHETQSEDDS